MGPQIFVIWNASVVQIPQKESAKDRFRQPEQQNWREQVVADQRNRRLVIVVSPDRAAESVPSLIVPLDQAYGAGVELQLVTNFTVTQSLQGHEAEHDGLPVGNSANSPRNRSSRSSASANCLGPGQGLTTDDSSTSGRLRPA